MTIGTRPPWSTITAVLLGALGLWLLGRWDQSIGAREAAHRAQVQQVLWAGKAYRASQARLRASEEAAARQVVRLRADLDRMADSARSVDRSLREAATAAQDGPLAAVLPRLRLRALEVNLFGTDSTGVRFLAGLEVEARRGRELVPLLTEQATIGRRQVSILDTAVALAQQRATAAEGRVTVLEGLVEQGERLRRCRIAGLLPCPSRTTSFVLGACAAAILLIAR